MDSLCSPFSAASAQPLVIFRQRLAVFRHYSAYWRWPKFHTHVLDGSSNIWQKYSRWEGWGGGNLNSVLWLGAFALGLLVSQWQCSGTAPRGVQRCSAGSACRAPRSCPPSSCCCRAARVTCWNTAAEGRLWELAKAVYQIQFYSYGWCPVQNNILDVRLKRGKLDFFYFFLPHWTGYLLQSACYLYL